MLCIAAGAQHSVYVVDVWPATGLDVILEVDGSCVIKHASKEASQMFGYPSSALKGVNLAKLLELDAGASLCLQMLVKLPAAQSTAVLRHQNRYSHWIQRSASTQT